MTGDSYQHEEKFVITRFGEKGGIENYLGKLQYQGKETFEELDKYYFLDGEIAIELDIYKQKHELVLLTAKSDSLEALENYCPKDHRISDKKGFIRVSKNKIYQSPASILKYLYHFKLVVEGPKGVGKSTTIFSLTQKGISCRDRDQEVFSNDAVVSLPLEKRAKLYIDRIHRNKDEYFLLLDAEPEILKERRSHRQVIETGYVHEDSTYQQAYRETYQYLKEHNRLGKKLIYFNTPNYPIGEKWKQTRAIMTHLNQIESNKGYTHHIEKKYTKKKVYKKREK